MRRRHINDSSSDLSLTETQFHACVGASSGAGHRLFHNFAVISPQICPVFLPGPLFETHCSYVEARLAQFLSWNQNQAEADVGPFIDYPESEFWAYADYKYIAVLFQDFPSMFEVA